MINYGFKSESSNKNYKAEIDVDEEYVHEDI